MELAGHDGTGFDIDILSRLNAPNHGAATTEVDTRHSGNVSAHKNTSRSKGGYTRSCLELSENNTATSKNDVSHGRDISIDRGPDRNIA